MVIKRGAVVSAGPDVRGMVSLPITRAVAEGAREMRVPDMVIAEAPGISVCLPIKYSEALLGSIVVPFIVSGGRPWAGLGEFDSGSPEILESKLLFKS